MAKSSNIKERVFQVNPEGEAVEAALVEKFEKLVADVAAGRENGPFQPERFVSLEGFQKPELVQLSEWLGKKALEVSNDLTPDSRKLSKKELIALRQRVLDKLNPPKKRPRGMFG